MKKIVIDTNVLIDYLRTGKGLFLKLVELQKENKVELYLSSMSILELFVGKSSQKSSLKILQLIDIFIVIPLDRNLAKLAGEVKRDNNLSIAIADLVIAASAIYINGQIATRNTRHYQGIPKLRFYPLD